MTAIDFQSAPVEAAPVFDWRLLLKRLGPLVGFAFVFGLFSVLRPRLFLSYGNLQIMLLQTAVVGTAALGMTMIIIAGGIDLSPGSNIALTTVVIAVLLQWNWPPFWAALGGIFVATLVGLLIGALVIGRFGEVASGILGIGTFLVLSEYFTFPLAVAIPAAVVLLILCMLASWRFLPRVPISSFIVTLGLWGSIRGVAEQVGGNSTVYPPHATWLNELLLTPTGDHWWWILPIGVWMTIVLAIIVALALRYTKFGRHIFAIGSNEQTARLCGVNLNWTKLLIYTIAAVFVGIAGVLQFSYLTMGDPTTAFGLELNIIAAVVIGGASLNGGEGSVFGSMIGALMMTAVANGCTKMGWQNSVELMVTGGIIIIAVWLDGLRHQRAG
ncbi:MAG TPA: ABC transporter permease [Tepidisphaeraceae bacterium]|nr:ABC transporter permease [Tepidisphaeraceae bacterium]